MLTREAGLLTGTVAIVSTDRTHGSIESKAGAPVPFRMAAVLAYDVSTIAVGQMVAFDLAAGRYPTAVNVSVCRLPTSTETRGRRDDAPSLRYLGFEQNGAVRVFNYEQRAPGQERSTSRVTAELALFTKYRLPLQDGPVMCLKWLKDELAHTQALSGPDHALTDADVLAYLASRPAPTKRPFANRLKERLESGPTVAAETGRDKRETA